MTLRIGIVGAGGNTRLRHIPGFQAIDGVDVVAVANRSVESGRSVAKEFRIPRVVDDWRRLVTADDVDAVCIGTWPNLHCPITLAALTAGKHVLTEARMAMNLDEARQMHAAAKASGKVAMVVPAPLHLRAERTVLDLLADGHFGALLEIQINALSGGWNPGAPLGFRHVRARSGNNIMSMGIVNETVRRYAGHERRLLAMGKTFIGTRVNAESGANETCDVPDSLGIVAEHLNGATAVYHFSSVAHGGRTAFEFHGTKGAFKLEDSKAWVCMAGESGFRELEVPAHKEGGWRVEREFVDAIRDGAPITHTSFDDGLKYMAFTDAVRESLTSGATVDVAQFD